MPTSTTPWSYVAAAAPVIGIACCAMVSLTRHATDQFLALAGLGIGLVVLGTICGVGTIAAAVSLTKHERPLWVPVAAGVVNLALTIPAIAIAILKDWD